MAKLIYKPGDIIPIVLNVLHHCLWCYVCNGFKIAVKDYFPDLKGIAKTDECDEASIGLLNSIDEGLIPLIRESVNYLQWARDAISDLYGIAVTPALNDVRLMELANDIYQDTIIDDFPSDGEHDDYNDIVYDQNTEIYAMSLLNVVNWLFILLMTGETDLELSFDDDHFYLDFFEVDYRKEDHASALEILKELGEHLQDQHSAIVDHVY